MLPPLYSRGHLCLAKRDVLDGVYMPQWVSCPNFQNNFENSAEEFYPYENFSTSMKIL